MLWQCEISIKEINELVVELNNDKIKLKEFINECLPEETEEHIESVFSGLRNRPLALKRFIIKSLEDWPDQETERK